MLKVIILLNIILMIFSLTYLLIGGVFTCTVSVTSQMIGYAMTILSFLLLISVQVITEINNNTIGSMWDKIKTLLPIILPSVITVIDISFITKILYDRQNKLKRKRVNVNYHFYNGLYKLNVMMLLFMKMIGMIFFELFEISQSFYKSVLFYIIWILSISCAILSYFVHHYLSL